MKDKVLIVDDIDINRLILREILSNDYDIAEAEDGMKAISLLFESTENLPNAILLDIMMPEMDGFEVLSLIKANPATEKIPVLFITAADANTNETRGLKEGAVDYISKPFNPDVVKARVDNHIKLMRYQTELEHLVEKKTADLTRTHAQMLETLATIIEYRSLESGAHIRRTCDLTRILIEQMLPNPLFKEELIKSKYSSIISAVALHDVGKVGISDSILLKPGRLTDEEFNEMKKHSVIGYNIIKTIALDMTDDAHYLKHCMDICRHHHERWDGKGYPDGLSGKDIPLSARIVSIVDVYDALVSERCYKPPFTHEEAVDIINKGAGTQFDPDVVKCFMEIHEKFREYEKA